MEPKRGRPSPATTTPHLPSRDELTQGNATTQEVERHNKTSPLAGGIDKTGTAQRTSTGPTATCGVSVSSSSCAPSTTPSTPRQPGHPRPVSACVAGGQEATSPLERWRTQLPGGSPNLQQQQLAALLRGQRKKGFKCGRKSAKEGLHGFPVPTNNQGSERYHQTQKPL
jgi:hypothetical protein